VVELINHFGDQLNLKPDSKAPFQSYGKLKKFVIKNYINGANNSFKCDGVPPPLNSTVRKRRKYMDNTLEKRVRLIEEDNKKLKLKSKLLTVFICFWGGMTALYVVSDFNDHSIFFHEDNFNKTAELSFETVRISDIDRGHVALGFQQDNTQSLELTNCYVENPNTSNSISLQNQIDSSSLTLWNKGLINLSAKEFPVFKLKSKQKSKFEFTFSENGSPYISLTNQSGETYQLTIEDIKKLKN